MGLSPTVVERLRALGHDAVHLREQQLQRLPDSEVFTKAIAEQRVLLTFDLDFGEIVALQSGRLASVILFRVRRLPIGTPPP